MHRTSRAVVGLLIAGLGGLGLAAAAHAAPSTSPSPVPSGSPTAGSPQNSARASTAPTSMAPTSMAPTSTVGGSRLGQPGRQIQRGPGATRLPKIDAASWILADAVSGQVLAAKNAHVQRPPASTLKTLTALTLLPVLPRESTTVATRKATRADGTRVGLIQGKRYSIDSLMYGLLLASGNDAAIALAQANGGVRKTVQQMNALAHSLQANDTVARNPSGLDADGQVSSAYDLALIARAALTRQDFVTFTSTARYDFPGKGRRSYPIYNQNRLVTGDYRGAIGVKMGFTSQAGRTFIAAATRKGRTLIFVGMGIVPHSDQAARTALDWGFKNADNVTPIGQLVAPLPQAATTSTATPEPTTPIDLSRAGLDLPSASDPMAPWWFWLLLAAIISSVLVGLRLVRSQGRIRRAGFERAQAIRVDYHPYDPR